jgi:hypothetical protein
MVRRLIKRTRRRLKNRSKYSRSKRSHSRNNKYKKTRSRKYIKKRRNMTRRRVLRGGLDYDNIQLAFAAVDKFPKGFKEFVDILKRDPYVMMDGGILELYKRKIELKSPTGDNTGFIGKIGLQFVNYLLSRIKKINKDSIEYDNLQTAISLMDQNAAAPGITCEQLNHIKKRTSKAYYCCYIKLFNELAKELEIKIRDIPVSTSACCKGRRYDCNLNECDDSCTNADTCCIPTGLPPEDD